MASESIRISGLSGALATLKALPPEIVSKNGGPVRSAIRAGAKVLQQQVQANLQVIIDTPNIHNSPNRSTGFLKKNIIIQRGRRNTTGELMLIRVKARQFYPQTGKGKRVSAAEDAFMLEHGTERRAAYPFFQPAFDLKKDEAARTFAADLDKRLIAIQSKLERQNGAVT